MASCTFSLYAFKIIMSLTYQFRRKEKMENNVTYPTWLGTNVLSRKGKTENQIAYLTGN
jgi:hypothetical protein